MTTAFRLLTTVVLGLALAGCQSFGRGVARAIIEESRAAPGPDMGLCEITGPSFEGLASGFLGASRETPKTIRLLIVHGIGEQLPGYSERLQRNLAARLGLDAIDPAIKTVKLIPSAPVAEHADNPEHGTLRIARFTDGLGRHLLTFEVTWSVITAPDRQRMKFDGVGAAADTRAALNASLKNFMNQRVADPLAYRGGKGEAIRDAVLQSICWMTTGPWTSYPDTAARRCAWSMADRATVEGDSFAISSHSLGSRIAMDALESLGAIDAGEPGGTDHPLTAFRAKSISFFMLSNQLPMLQIGLVPPEMTGRADRYCGADAPEATRRWFDKLSVVAFSDPNDLLSYAIPPDFAAGNLDSRLCAATTNVLVKVAKELDLAVTTFASPEAAHLQYEHNAAVLDLMVNGLGAAAPPARCSWLRYTPAAE
ncbi:MAG: hypothetical protein SFV21_17240 [Rhodospirillaceae bacterium]|nr:hypothetical protein [Rhodospirillaceae bacterium]